MTNALRSGPIGASRELGQVIESLISSSAVPTDATLCDVRAVVLSGGIFLSGEGELLFPQDRTFLVIELDDLIDCYGAQARARGFTHQAHA